MGSSITALISPDIYNAIFYTLIQTLWQIPVIALGIKLVNRQSKQSILSNYHANFSAILISIVTAGFTFFYFMLKNIAVTDSLGAVAATGRAVENSSILFEAETSLGQSFSWTEWLVQFDAYIVLFWLLGVMLLLSRIIAGWIGLHFIKKDLSFSVPLHLHSTFNKIKHRLGVNGEVQLALSSLCTIPMVIGHMKPIVLLPIATLNQLSTEEVEAILAHELAHIIQYDFIKNLIVMVGEAIFFYHPVIWMLSAEIKEGREHCCDDTVMRLYPNRVQYARTLVKLEEMYIGNSSSISMGLFNSKFKLMKRVKRILNMQHESNNGKMKIAIVALLMCSLLVFSSADLKVNEEIIASSSNPDNIIANIVTSGSELLPIASPVFPEFEEKIEKVEKVEKRKYDQTIAPLSMTSPKEFAQPVTSWSFKVVTPALDTLDKEEREKLKKKLKEKRKEVYEKTKEIKSKMKEQREKFRAEHKEELDKKRAEIREIRKKLREDGHTFHSGEGFDFDFDFDHEKLEKWTGKMAEWGARFGTEISEKFNDEWASDMADIGEGMTFTFDENWVEKWENFGAQFGEEMEFVFDEEWIDNMANIGNDFSFSFDEDWKEEMATVGEEVSKAVALAMEGFENNNYNYNYTYGTDIKDSKKLKSTLVDKLNRDGLLTDNKNTIIISDTEMTVNGTTQSDAQLKAFQDIIKMSSPTAFIDAPTKVKFVIYGKSLEESKSTYLTVNVDK